MRRRGFFATLPAAAVGAVAVGAATTATPSSAQAHHSSAEEKRNMVRAIVVREAQDLGVSPALGLAIAHTESMFNPRAESHVGARGVMQIMPATCRGEYGLHADILWDPRVNVRMGLHFVGRLIRQYQGHEHFALSWYNGGSRVGSLPNARIIPATQPYVDKVLGLKADYDAKLRRHGGREWGV